VKEVNYKGTIIGMKKRTAVVMTEDCGFKEIKKDGLMFCGQQVCFSDADLVPDRKSPHRLLAIAASFLLCFLLAYSLVTGITAAKVYAYVSIDVNPSVELWLDREFRVIRILGLNGDGKLVAGNVDLRGQDVDGAFEKLFKTFSDRQFIGSNGKDWVVITTVLRKRADDGGSSQRNLDYLLWATAREKIAGSGEKVTLHVIDADPALRKQAGRKGVSTGQYLLWLKARERGILFDLDGVPLSKETRRYLMVVAGQLTVNFHEDDLKADPELPRGGEPGGLQDGEDLLRRKETPEQGSGGKNKPALKGKDGGNNPVSSGLVSGGIAEEKGEEPVNPAGRAGVISGGEREEIPGYADAGIGSSGITGPGEDAYTGDGIGGDPAAGEPATGDDGVAGDDSPGGAALDGDISGAGDDDSPDGAVLDGSISGAGGSDGVSLEVSGSFSGDAGSGEAGGSGSGW